VLWPDGSLHWLELEGRVYRDATGRPVHMAGTVIDITARRQAEAARTQAEAALVASERRFRALIDHCADAVALFDQHGVVQYISPAATRLLGYDLTTFLGENAFDFIHPAERQSTADQLAKRVFVHHVFDSFQRFAVMDSKEDGRAESNLGQRAVDDFRSRGR